MMNFIKKYKTSIIILVLILLVFWAYSIYFPRVEVFLESSAEPVGEELFSVLSTLRNIEFNDEILSDPDFLSLQDFETAISPERAGRSNPFGPTGGDSGGVLVEPIYSNSPVSPAETFVETIGTTTPNN